MAYSIITIQGEGENSEYTKLADSLVRRSRIFKSLCKKIYKIKAKVGTKNYHMETWKKKCLEAKKKLSEISREADKVITEQEKEIKRLNNIIQARENSIKNYRIRTNNLILEKNAVKKLKNRFALAARELLKIELFLTKELHWFSDKASHIMYVEMMLRILFNYKSLAYRNQAKYHELMYLGIGTELDAFGYEEVECRFGDDLTRNFKNDISDLIIKGYIRKFNNRNMYYLTSDGKERIQQLMSLLIDRKSYTYWKRILEGIKRVRDV